MRRNILSSLSSCFAKKEDEPLFFLFVGPESEIHQEDFFLADAKPTNVMNEGPCCGKRPRPRFFLVLQIRGKIRKAKKSRVCSVSSEKNCSVMTKMFSLDLQHSTSKHNFLFLQKKSVCVKRNQFSCFKKNVVVKKWFFFSQNFWSRSVWF